MNIMLDIETLSSKPNGIILSVAAVPFYFEVESPSLAPFQMNCSIDEQYAKGRHIDTPTLQWWMHQPRFKERYKDQHHPTYVLHGLVYAIENWKKGFNAKSKDVRLWAKSPSYDLVMLKSLADDFYVKLPWKFYQERDVRTLYELGDIDNNSLPDAPHNPIEDCNLQIKYCIKAYNNIK